MLLSMAFKIEGGVTVLPRFLPRMGIYDRLFRKNICCLKDVLFRRTVLPPDFDKSMWFVDDYYQKLSWSIQVRMTSLSWEVAADNIKERIFLPSINIATSR